MNLSQWFANTHRLALGIHLRRSKLMIVRLIKASTSREHMLHCSSLIVGWSRHKHWKIIERNDVGSHTHHVLCAHWHFGHSLTIWDQVTGPVVPADGHHTNYSDILIQAWKLHQNLGSNLLNFRRTRPVAANVSIASYLQMWSKQIAQQIKTLARLIRAKTTQDHWATAFLQEPQVLEAWLDVQSSWNPYAPRRIWSAGPYQSPFVCNRANFEK